jgi:hypothetical protein
MDGSTSWLPLKESKKETNTIETAQYAVHNMTDKEPAFDWWTRDVLKRKKRLMKMPQSRHKQSDFKFGIRIPRNTKEALEINHEDGKSALDTPVPTDFHPELDTSDFLDKDGIWLYQS